MVLEVLVISVNIVNRVEPSTLLLDQETVHFECRQEAPEIGSGGGIVTVEGLDDVMDGYDGGVPAPYGKDHLVDPPSIEGGQLRDREQEVRGRGFGGRDAEGYIGRDPDPLFEEHDVMVLGQSMDQEGDGGAVSVFDGPILQRWG